MINWKFQLVLNETASEFISGKYQEMSIEYRVTSRAVVGLSSVGNFNKQIIELIYQRY